MSFYCAITCMDGRIQLPVIKYLQDTRYIHFVDMVTAAGPVQFFASQDTSVEKDALLVRAEISINAHNAQGLALVAHHDCAGNPIDRNRQVKQLRQGVKQLAQRFPEHELLALWVNSDWAVENVAWK